MPPDSDSSLVDRARSGEVRAFQCLFERHARAAYAVCLRLLGDPALAEDAVQEAFLKAHRRLDQYDGRAAFSVPGCTGLRRTPPSSSCRRRPASEVADADEALESHRRQRRRSAGGDEPGATGARGGEALGN
jgi:DNA-directed RNA polymerase specialized sigma24 family protein